MSVPGGSEADLSAWDSVAGTYAGLVDGTDSISARFASFLAEELGPLPGRRILDLGCGHGWLSARMAAEGAEVVGVDGSRELLAIGRSRYPGLDLREGDLSRGLGPLGSETFDRVVALMVFMDVVELESLLADVSRCLAPDGRLIFTMTHPCFWAQSPVEDPVTGERYRKVRGYLGLEERWVGSFGGHRHYHRPLSWYIDRLVAAGLTVTRLCEPATPPADNRSPAEWTEYEAWMATIPTMIGISARPLSPRPSDAS